MKNVIVASLCVLNLSGCRTTDSSGVKSTSGDAETADQRISLPEERTPEEEQIAMFSGVENGDLLIHVCDDHAQIRKFAFLRYQGLNALSATRPLPVKVRYGNSSVHEMSYRCVEVIKNGGLEGFTPGSDVHSRCDEKGNEIEVATNPVTGVATGATWRLQHITNNWVMIRQGNRSGWVPRACLVSPNS